MDAALFDLIDKNKFHSCVILGYNADIGFLNDYFIPKLKKKRIFNTMVFVDGYCFNDSLSMFKANIQKDDSFTISPIFSKYAFHPKLIFLTGNDTGLLITGSGNPNYCGYESNGEVWYKIEYNKSNLDSLPILISVWHYIKKITETQTGINKIRLDWISRYSQWLNGNNLNEKSSYVDKNGNEIYLLSNVGSSIYSKLRNIVESIGVLEINLFSPFFDSKNIILQNLVKDYKPIKLNVFLQKNNVVMNYSYIKSLPGEISFYESNRNEKYIHAKIIEFITPKNSYFLVGSANMTTKGIGILNSNETNEELCILIKRNDTNSYFDNLSLLKEVVIEREELFNILADKKDLIKYEDNNHNNTKIIKILSIDLLNNVFTLSSKDNIPENSYLVYTQINDDIVIEKVKIKYSDQIGDMYKYIYECEKSIKFEGLVGYLYDSENQTVISNKVLIQDIFKLNKTNPDPYRKKITEAISKIASEESDIHELINVLEPEIVLKKQHPKAVFGRVKKNILDNEDNGASSKEEFLEVDIKGEIESNYLADKSTLNYLMEVIMKLLRSKDEKIDPNFDEEEDSTTTSSNKIEVITQRKPINSLDNSKREVKRFNRYFVKNINFLKKHIDDEQLHLDFSITLLAINSYLLLMGYLKDYNDKDSETFRLLSYNDNVELNTEGFKSHAINLFGVYYGCYASKLNIDQNILENDDLISNSVKQSLYNSYIILSLIYSIELRAPGPESSKILQRLYLIALNILKFAQKNSLKAKHPDIVEQFELLSLKLNNIEEYREEIANKYEVLMNNLNRYTELSEPLTPETYEQNALCYSVKYGFAIVKTKTRQPLNGWIKVMFAAPGVFNYNKKKQEYLSDFVNINEKSRFWVKSKYSRLEI